MYKKDNLKEITLNFTKEYVPTIVNLSHFCFRTQCLPFSSVISPNGNVNQLTAEIQPVVNLPIAVNSEETSEFPLLMLEVIRNLFWKHFPPPNQKLICPSSSGRRTDNSICD